MYRRLPRTRSARPWAYGALSVAVLAALGWVVLATSVLGVRSVDVSGSSVATPDEVRAVAAVVPGTPLARVDTGAVAERVRGLPSVASVAVIRVWPHTLAIEVTERVGVAVVAAGDAYAVLDASGVLFRTASSRPAGLPLIRVATPGPADATTRAVLRVVGALTPELRDRLRVVEAESPNRITVRLRGDRVVVWGDADASETKARVATSLLNGPGGTIDVSAPDVATVS